MTEKENLLSFEIKTLVNLVKREVGASERGRTVANATGNNAFIIGYLAHHEGEDVFQRDLEEKFSVRRSTMSNTIMLMEQKGFLTRTPVSYDARLKKLTLTEDGWRIHHTLESAIRDAEAKLTGGLTEEEKETLFALLEKMRSNFD